ncbi:MAG: acyl carrier protein [Candidatus Omnitrophota bacterium]
MENKGLQQEIIELISNITETDLKREDVKTSFIEGVNVDSLMALEIVAALEKKYKIEIKEEHLPKLNSIEDMAGLVEELIKEKDSKQATGKISPRKIKKPKGKTTVKTKKAKKKKK